MPTKDQIHNAGVAITTLENIFADGIYNHDNDELIVYYIIRKKTAGHWFIDVYTIHENLPTLITTRVAEACMLTLTGSKGISPDLASEGYCIKFQRGVGFYLAEQLSQALRTIFNRKTSAVEL